MNWSTINVHPDKFDRAVQWFWSVVTDHVQPLYDAVGFYFG